MVFDKFGIFLETGINWHATRGASLTIRGVITDGKPDAAIFLVNSSNQLVKDSLVFVTADTSNQTFQGEYVLPTTATAGVYYLGISSSENSTWHYQNPPYFLITP